MHFGTRAPPLTWTPLIPNLDTARKKPCDKTRKPNFAPNLDTSTYPGHFSKNTMRQHPSLKAVAPTTKIERQRATTRRRIRFQTILGICILPSFPFPLAFALSLSLSLSLNISLSLSQSLSLSFSLAHSLLLYLFFSVPLSLSMSMSCVCFYCLHA